MTHSLVPFPAALIAALVFTGWVVSIFWESERPDNPIPARYLQNDPTVPPA
jgi:hypothetical protein